MLHSADQAPAAFAIDFGVLTDGQTALVELNDGFSIGTYGLSGELYADFTAARWAELVARVEPVAVTLAAPEQE